MNESFAQATAGDIEMIEAAANQVVSMSTSVSSSKSNSDASAATIGDMMASPVDMETEIGDTEIENKLLVQLERLGIMEKESLADEKAARYTAFSNMTNGGNMTILATKKGNVGIKQPVFRKLEAEVSGGLARISQRHALIEAELVLGYDMDGVWLNPGDFILLPGDSAQQQWSANQYVQPDGLTFVLCPEALVLGYKKNAPDQL